MRHPITRTPARLKASRSVTVSLVLIAALAHFAATATAQGRVRAVTGTVTDTSGAIVPGARVEALVAGQRVATAITGPDGRYRLDLDPGTAHQLRAGMNGFADETSDLPAVAGPASRDFVLKPAGLSDVVIVTADRLPERPSATTASIAVFSSNDLERLGSSSLADVVRMVPGLSVESNGREGAVASLFARGGESDYNLVLIDGVRVNQSGGTFDFSRVSAAEIDRVEIVRGAQSALYGSDAIGSVVQLFTRRATPGDPPALVGSFEGGSFGTVRADAHLLGGARRRIDYQLGVAHRRTEGAFQDILPEHDTFRETSVDGSIGGILGSRVSLRSGFRYGDGNGKGIGPIDYGSRDTGTSAETRDLSWHVDFADRISPRLTHTAMFDYYRSNRLSADTITDPTYRAYAILTGTPRAIFPDGPRLVQLIDQATFAAYQSGARTLGAGELLATTPFGISDFPFTSESQFRRPAFKYQADFTWADARTLTGGYEYERETDPLHPDFLVENHAYFVQQRIAAADRLYATAGARLDHNSRYGNQVSPKGGIGAFLQPYRAAPLSSVKVFANVGRGIKNPTFGELYGSAFTDGNPNLSPERARTVDAGVEATFHSQRVLGRVTYFDNAYNDQVAFLSSGPGVDGRPDFVNIEGSAAKGWELEAALQRPVAGGLTASAGYAFVDTKVVSSVSTNDEFQSGQPLLRRPKHSAAMRVTYARSRMTVNVNLRYVGQRHDAAFLGLAAVPSPQFPAGRSVDITVNPAYTLLWLGGEFRLARQASVFARIDNLADTSYESALGYPGLPRSIVGGVRFSVK